MTTKRKVRRPKAYRPSDNIYVKVGEFGGFLFNIRSGHVEQARNLVDWLTRYLAWQEQEKSK